MAEGWNTPCEPTCIYEHLNVGALSKPSLDLAIRGGTTVFGPLFETENWPDKMRAAFKYPRMLAIRTVKGELISRDDPAVVAASGGGRGAGRSGRGGYLGRNASGRSGRSGGRRR